MKITIDDRTIRARKFASQIMPIIGDCVSDKDGAQSRLIDAAYQTDVEIAKVAEWKPIETAPKNAWILIADDKCWPPDLVRWQSERPERMISGNRYLAVQEGWFGSPGGRSRFDVPDGHLMKATRWHPLPQS